MKPSEEHKIHSFEEDFLSDEPAKCSCGMTMKEYKLNHPQKEEEV